MKLAGILTLVASFMAALVFALLPATVTFFGTDVSCGAPVWRVVDGVRAEAYSEVDELCYDASLPRVLIAGGLLLLGGAGGTLLLVLGRRD